MVVTILIGFLIFEAAWVVYAMKTAPIIDDEEVSALEEENKESFPNI